MCLVVCAKLALIVFIFLLVMSLAILVLNHLQPNVAARSHKAFLQEARCDSSELNTRWMASISDNEALQLLSIPGSHNSMSRFGGERLQTQTMSLLDQLEAGIRALDIRCRHMDNQFPLYHGFVYQQMDLSDVFTICQRFLQQNPSEVIIVRIKEEWHPKRNTETFEQTFATKYFIQFGDLFWIPSLSDIQKEKPIPLGSVRRKVVIMQNFKSNQTYYGPLWDNFFIQDSFFLYSRNGLKTKWIKIKTHLYNANNSVTYRNDELTSASENSLQFYVNFLSGTGFVKPYFVASGHVGWGTNSTRHYCGVISSKPATTLWDDFPQGDKIIGDRYALVHCEGTNILTYELLTKRRFHFVGLVYSDFPGCGLIQAIIDVNQATSIVAQIKSSIEIHFQVLIFVASMLIVLTTLALFWVTWKNGQRTNGQSLNVESS